MTYKDQEVEALLHGVKSARSLAHRCLLTAKADPRYAQDDLREASRHFARAHWYLDSARMMRASHAHTA